MRYILSILLILAVSCGRNPGAASPEAVSDAPEFFTIPDSSHVVLLSPYGGPADTIDVSVPMRKIVCMSTSYIAYLDAAWADSAICGVSGLDYVSSPELLARNDVADVGYDAELDYERILAMKPDCVAAYSVSFAEPLYVSKLKSLGVRVIMVSDHLESHPLARAGYIRLFGALTGHMHEADSAYNSVRDNYMLIKASADTTARKKVLFNIPYGGQWFIPGSENYMSRLVRDAGGEVSGAAEGSRESSVISIEQAYALASGSDVWLNPGWCATRSQLASVNPLFEKFGIGLIFNNTLRTNAKGGNDFWESGAARPDLVLEDLVGIFSGRRDSFHYYIEVK